LKSALKVEKAILLTSGRKRWKGGLQVPSTNLESEATLKVVSRKGLWLAYSVIIYTNKC
jgi:hypothetical protein